MEFDRVKEGRQVQGYRLECLGKGIHKDQAGCQGPKKNSSKGPSKSWILQTGLYWQRLGVKEIAWGGSSSVNMWVVGATLGIRES